jgi:nucleoside-diphosphate-sugar epimerase
MADLGDRRIAQLASERLPRCDAIVHAAAAIDADRHAAAVSLTNALGTQQMLQLAESWGVSRFVYISSVPIVGRPRELPITEQHPADPPTAYHASKLYGEHLVELGRRAGLTATMLRLTSPVGPGMPDGRIFSVFVRRALMGDPLEVAGEGGRRQDYVDVRDVAASVQACLERPATGRFNIAAGRSVSNLELAQSCIEVLRSSSEVELGSRPDPDEHLRWDVSIERARSELGYAPACSLNDSIEAAAADARSEPLAPRSPLADRGRGG